ncbi:gibberellin-regulated protein 14-like [Cornus florida]|uniref:gibberellin-regulated protein 14-like n=1 Tax=Cornus florida TaxID=4283 RepID=UPI00289D859D|nr:gibberellin-regulated protein 14-like [Cornus florida]
MAFKAMLFLLASFLLVTARVSSKEEEEFLMEDFQICCHVCALSHCACFEETGLFNQAAYAKVPVPAPAHIPVKAPPPAHVPIKAPPASPPVKAPAPPVKPPVSSPPVKEPAPPVKPPVSSPPVKPPPKTTADCIPLCKERCGAHSRKRRCLRACVTCCDRCKCVPPGTYGNREKCGKCYTDMTTTGGKLKCP